MSVRDRIELDQARLPAERREQCPPATRREAAIAIARGDRENHRLFGEDAAIGGEERQAWIEEFDRLGAGAVDLDDLEVAATQAALAREADVEAGDMQVRHARGDRVEG